MLGYFNIISYDINNTFDPAIGKTKLSICHVNASRIVTRVTAGTYTIVLVMLSEYIVFAGVLFVNAPK
jgi:hypothetical protein